MQLLSFLDRAFGRFMKKKLLFGGLFVVFLFVGMMTVHTAHADELGSALNAFSPTAGALYNGADIAANATGATKTDVAGWGIAYVLSFLATVLNTIVSGIGSITLVVIEALIIPILNYNGFSSSPIIGLGWSLVRDVVNMFVVIILLVIAIRTILGMHGAHWQQQIPQLFLTVVMVNFSRTICGLLIDVSQVVMFTFVNALLDIAAGNFVQLWHLDLYGQIAIENGTQSALDAASQVMNAFLQIPLYGSIFAIMVLLAGAFVWRIIILWILVIMSPLAFFLNGMKGILPIGGAGDWWGKFTAALVMGPLLTFFLWLALAAASSGSLVTSEGFPVPENPKTYGLSLEVFDSSNVLNTIIALILLIVGMQQAGAYAGKLEGLAKSAINEGMGRRVVEGSARLPFIAGAAAGSYAGRTLDRNRTLTGFVDGRLGNSGSLSVRESLAKTGIAAGRSLAASSRTSLGFTAGRAVMSAFGKVEGSTEKAVHADIAAAQEKVKGMEDDQKLSQISLLDRMLGSSLTSMQDEGLVLAAAIATDPNLQKKYKDHFGEDGLKKVLAIALPVVDEKKNAVLDDSKKNTLKGQMVKHLDALSLSKEGQKKAESFIGSDDFVENYKKLHNQTRFLDDKDEQRRDSILKTVLRNTKDGPVTVEDEIRSGALGDKTRRKLEEIDAKNGRNSGRRKMEKLLENEATVEKLKKSFSDRSMNGSSVTSPDLQGSNGNNIVTAMVESRVDISNNPNIKQDFVNNVMNSQRSEVISKAFSNEQVAASDLTPDVLNSPNGAQVVRGILDAKTSLEGASADAVAAFNAQVRALHNQNEISTRDLAKAGALVANAQNSLEGVLSGISRDASGEVTLDRTSRAELRQMWNTDITSLRHAAELESTAAAGGGIVRPAGSTDVTRIIVNNITTAEIGQIGEIAEATKAGEKKNALAALDAVADAARREHQALSAMATRNDEQQKRFEKAGKMNSQVEQVRKRLGLS